jgi:glucose/arabinose dehydrogenase
MKHRNQDFAILRYHSMIFIGILALLSVIILQLPIKPIYSSSNEDVQPSLRDPKLNVRAIVDQGLSSPASMTFMNENNILVLEKNSGDVRLVIDGVLKAEPVLHLEVDNTTLTCCRGLLGIETLPRIGGISYVFLYVTESSSNDENQEIKNRVYRYQWDGQSLVNPKIILDLPAEPGPNHPGGKLKLGPDGYLYTVIGDLNNDGMLQNFRDGPSPDASSVILKVNSTDGSGAQDNPFRSITQYSNASQIEKYYAYGIRNSFGLAIDPVNGTLWDTENGDKDYDEINVVEPGFNSGWEQLMGPISESDIDTTDLVSIPGSDYSDPALSFAPSLGLTDIEFLSSSMLGDRYMNNIFVGDINNGNLYFFELNGTRNGLKFDPTTQSGLGDRVADGDDELDEIVLGTGFRGITDIETGPDGFLYILTFDQESGGDGKIYRISSNDNSGFLN